MATYGTDLVVLATGSDGESGTWTEFLGWSSGGNPGAETENFIQGTQSQSQSFGNATTGKSIAFDAGSDISASIPSNDVVMGWVYMGAPTNMYNYSTGGHRFAIAADNGGVPSVNMDMWSISGDDRAPNPYGGWWNIAIDPTHTPDYTTGTGAGGVMWYFGSMIGDTTLGIRVKIQKGNPHAVDGMRMGRGEIYCTGTGATFTLMAADNDLVANRWGLLQDTGGDSFLWKGLMSLGQSGTSATFTASNQNIKIDDTAKTYAGFNKIEIRNASTSVTWNNISFSAAGTFAPGLFEMVENAATVDLTGCTFNNMGTFIFLSNAALTGCNWNGCGVITHGGATFLNSNFAGYEGTAGTAYLVYNETPDPDGELDGCEFTKGTAATHAIEFGASTPSSITLRDGVYSGYNAANGNNDSTFYNNTGGALTINVVGATGNVSYRNGAGASTTIVADPVTLLVTVQTTDGTKIEDARVLALAGATGVYPFEDVVTITRVTTTASVAHTAHGMANGDLVVIENAVQNEYNGIQTISNVSTNAYDFTVAGSPTTPATGTILATTAIISGLTDVNGEISDTRTYSSDQDLGGRVRKSTGSPYYKTGAIVGTISSTNGLDLTIVMLSDE